MEQIKKYIDNLENENKELREFKEKTEKERIEKEKTKKEIANLEEKILNKVDGYVQLFEENFDKFDIDFILNIWNTKNCEYKRAIITHAQTNKDLAFKLLINEYECFDVLFSCNFTDDEIVETLCTHKSFTTNRAFNWDWKKITDWKNMYACIDWSCRNKKYVFIVQKLLNKYVLTSEQYYKLITSNIDEYSFDSAHNINFAKALGKMKLTKNDYERLYLFMEHDAFTYYVICHQPHIWEYAQYYNLQHCCIMYEEGKFDIETTKKMVEKLRDKNDRFKFGIIYNIPEIIDLYKNDYVGNNITIKNKNIRELCANEQLNFYDEIEKNIIW